MLWACGLSAGVVLLFIETISGLAVLPIVVIVGILVFSAFGIRLMQTRESASIVGPSRSDFSGFYRSRRVNFDYFTKEERVSWLRNEPNFMKRIVTPLEMATSKRRDYGRIFQSFVTRTTVEIRARLSELLSALTV